MDDGDLALWRREWENCFSYLRDGVPGFTAERIDPALVTLKSEKVGPNHYKIGPVKPLYSEVPTGPIRLGSDGRLRRRWSDVPTAERRKLFIPFELIEVQILPIPPDGQTWERLLTAKTVRQIRAICSRSRYWQPIKRERCKFLLEIDSPEEQQHSLERLITMARSVSPRLQELHNHADNFLAAKAQPRFPQSSRPSSNDSRLRFLAGAMAAVTLKRSARTVLDSLARLREVPISQDRG